MLDFTFIWSHIRTIDYIECDGNFMSRLKIVFLADPGQISGSMIGWHGL